MFVNFLNDIVDSLKVGSVYALIAIAFTIGANITGGLMNFVNGQLFVIGIYVVSFCHDLGMPFSLSVISSILVCVLFNVAIERKIYKPLLKRTKIDSLIVSIGLAFFIQNVFVMLFKSDPKILKNIVTGGIKIGSFEIEYTVILALLVSVTCMFAIYEFLKYTKLGRMVRAISENSESAALMGMPNDRIISFVFAICAILLVFAGTLYYTFFTVVDPYSGTMIGLRSLVGSLLGGLGIVPGSIPSTIPGALLGGFTVAFIEVMVKSYISVQMSDIVIFVVLAVFLFVNRKKYK